MGKILITGLTAFIFEVLILYMGSDNATAQRSFGVLLVVSMASFAIASIFMSLF